MLFIQFRQKNDTLLFVWISPHDDGDATFRVAQLRPSTVGSRKIGYGPLAARFLQTELWSTSGCNKPADRNKIVHET
jgi:hypothetical protein